MTALYTQSEIKPDALNTSDHSLFQALLSAGYLLQLVPVIIHVKSYARSGRAYCCQDMRDNEDPNYDHGGFLVFAL